MSSLIKKPRLHGSSRRLFRNLSRSGGFSTVVGRRLRRRLPVPSPKKRFLPFHLVLPCGSPWSSARGLSRDIITRLCRRTSELSSNYIEDRRLRDAAG